MVGLCRSHTFVLRFVVGLLFWGGVLLASETSGRQRADKIRAKVVVFLNEHCPIARFYNRELNALDERYRAQGIELVGLFPNRLATDASVAAWARRFKVNFPRKLTLFEKIQV